MKICMVVEAFEGDEIEATAADLSSALVDRGHEVTLVSLTGALHPSATLDARVNVTAFSRGKASVAVGDLVRLFEQDRPDVVVSHGARANTTAIAAGKLRSSPAVPVVAVEHRGFSMDATLSEDERRETALLAVPYSYKDADCIVCVFNSISELMALCDWLTEGAVRVIHNPMVPFDIFERSEHPIDEPWFQPGHSAVVLATGPLHHKQGYDIFLQALAVARYAVEVRGYLLGDGGELEALKQAASNLALEDIVAVHDEVSDKERFLRAANVFVLPRAGDGFDRNLAWAMALGTPVVAPENHPVHEELLRDADAARLFPEGDASALSKAIVDLSKYRKPAEDLTDRARAFSAERVFDAYEGLLKQVTRGGSGG
ncbi:glycosyltransferase [Pseudovibrio exalbescens]|uniref:glycosyltransferase n=1 Tax=Pseudovibrio exalbescens TaxID=197461 RepID=UPI0023654EE7|nr:glycosyltransferase [Pseudovibrio exalbescens]MDD7910736.1 glycosyltransferase [Pseudovibrio exalbescens]